MDKRQDLYSLTETPGYLTLKCADISATEKKTPAFVSRRLQHHKFECATRMSVSYTHLDVYKRQTRICKAMNYNGLHLSLHSVYLSKQRLYRLK